MAQRSGFLKLRFAFEKGVGAGEELRATGPKRKKKGSRGNSVARRETENSCYDVHFVAEKLQKLNFFSIACVA